jgi:hypothetical protein
MVNVARWVAAETPKAKDRPCEEDTISRPGHLSNPSVMRWFTTLAHGTAEIPAQTTEGVLQKVHPDGKSLPEATKPLIKGGRRQGKAHQDREHNVVKCDGRG